MKVFATEQILTATAVCSGLTAGEGAGLVYKSVLTVNTICQTKLLDRVVRAATERVSGNLIDMPQGVSQGT